MEIFEFKSQICTAKEQSEKLLALGLKKETADMMYVSTEATCMGRPIPEEDRHYEPILSPYTLPFGKYAIHIPAWSLHRLLFLIPKEVNIDGFKFPLRSDAIMRLEDADNMYERLIGIIERVIEQGYFNKDYLEEGV